MKFLFMVVVSCFFYSLAYVSAAGEFTPDDLANIALLMALAFSFQILFCKLLVKSRGGRNLFLAFFSLINIVSLNLILNESYLNFPVYVLSIMLLVGMFVLHTMMNIIDDSRLAGKILVGVMVIAAIGVLTKEKLEVGGLRALEPVKNARTSAENIKLVDFVNKPNVYFIAFDALIPESILRQHMGVESTAYHKVLNAHFRRFPNFFADAVSTKESLNILLALDKQYFYQQGRGRHAFFRGAAPSPLLEIFSHNGYTTNTLYGGQYFGNAKGPYVDNYFTLKRSGASGVCEFIDKKLKAYTFFGYCNELFRAKLNQLTFGFISLDRLDKTTHIDADEFYIQMMRDGLRKNKPQFFLSYIYSPGHTPATFNLETSGHLEKYKKVYIERSEKAAASIQKIVDFITNEDPGAILFIFGDHGPFLSKNISLEKNKRYHIVDRFGVYGGVFPSGRCAESFSRPYTEKFTTIIQGALMVIRCLSGGEEAFLKQDEFHLTIRKKALLDKLFTRTEDYRYEDFLYEK